MIRGADHMYSGEEEQVARTIATWADNRVLTVRRTEGARGKRGLAIVAWSALAVAIRPTLSVRAGGATAAFCRWADPRVR